MMAIRKEALLSLQIEGTQATMTDILIYETWSEVDNLAEVQSSSIFRHQKQLSLQNESS